MARIKHVEKARTSKLSRRCVMCPHEVQVGEAYKYIAKKTGPYSSTKLIFCQDCTPRTSHLLSGRSAEMASNVEGFIDSVSEDVDFDALSEALNDLISSTESMTTEIEEAANGIEEGLGHPTAQSEAMQETAYGLYQWKDSLQAVLDEVDGRESDGADTYERLYEEAIGAVDEEPELNLTG